MPIICLGRPDLSIECGYQSITALGETERRNREIDRNQEMTSGAFLPFEIMWILLTTYPWQIGALWLAWILGMGLMDAIANTIELRETK